MAESQGAHLPSLGMGWHAATSMSGIYLLNAGRPHQHVLYIKECVKVSKTHTQETGCKQAEVSGVQALLWAGGHAAEAQLKVVEDTGKGKYFPISREKRKIHSPMHTRRS